MKANIISRNEIKIHILNMESQALVLIQWTNRLNTDYDVVDLSGLLGSEGRHGDLCFYVLCFYLHM